MTGDGIFEHMVKNKFRHAHKAEMTENKQRRQKYEKSINSWPCVTVHQVYLIVQLGLGGNSCMNIHPCVL